MPGFTNDPIEQEQRNFPQSDAQFLAEQIVEAHWLSLCAAMRAQMEQAKTPADKLQAIWHLRNRVNTTVDAMHKLNATVQRHTRPARIEPVAIL